jgi:hypothetical protein
MPEAPTAAAAQATGQPEQSAAPREVRQITADRMRLAEVERQEWCVNAYFGTTVEHVLQPGYWANMASKMKPYDHVEVRVDDSTWLAHLLVLEAGRNWARVMVLAKWRLDGADVAQSIVAEEFKIEFKGPQLKWCVIRKRDAAYMSQQHRERSQAEDWLRSYERTLNVATA